MDTIVGISILDKRSSPQRLLVQCSTVRGSQEALIPVYPEGTPKPITPNGAAWAYKEVGDELHITPSLHIQCQLPEGWRTEFHNAFNWTTKFQVSDDRPIDPEWDANHLYEQLREANL